MDFKFLPLVELTQPLENFNLVSSEGRRGLASFQGELICRMGSVMMEDERTSVLSQRAMQQDRWERAGRMRKGWRCDTAVLQLYACKNGDELEEHLFRTLALSRVGNWVSESQFFPCSGPSVCLFKLARFQLVSRHPASVVGRPAPATMHSACPSVSRSCSAFNQAQVSYLPDVTASTQEGVTAAS